MVGTCEELAPSHAWTSFQCLFRGEHMPMRKLLTNSATPFCKSSLSIVDFLPAANERNDYGPIWKSVHNAEHYRRLGIHSTKRISLICSRAAEKFFFYFGCVPRALRLIKDNHTLRREV